MKKTILSLISIIICFVFVSCSPEVEEEDYSWLCAHRGYHSTAVENSLDAFTAALDLGCSWAELDVWATSDGHLVLTHDGNLKRCYGVDLNVKKVTFDELREVVTLSQVPELEDVWKAVGGKLKLQIEIKDMDAVEGVVDFFRLHESHDEAVVISFYPDALKKVKAEDPRITCGLLASYYSSPLLDLDYADFLALSYKNVSADVVKAVHERGKTITAWTVDKENDILSLYAIGVDGVTTNRPDLFLKETGR